MTSEKSTGTRKIDRARLQREKSKVEKEDPPEVKVSAGAIDKIVDLVGNPTRDAERGVTSITAMQAKLLPQLDIFDLMWQHYIELATYRQDVEEYEDIYKKEAPIFPNLIDEFTHRTAQWQKSIGGMNLKSMMDLALAETEARTGGDDDFSTNIDPYGRD